MITALRQLLPPCEDCKAPSANLFCDACLENLEFKNACPDCGHTPLHSDLSRCLSCAQDTHPWGELKMGFIYEGGLRTWLLDIKDRNRAERMMELKAEFLPNIQKSDYDCLVPVAADPLRTQTRMFDSTWILARRLGCFWGIPVMKDVFERREFLSSQKLLDRETRRRYLKKTISLTERAEELSEKRVLLVDDVMTTGTTLEIHAKLLKHRVKRLDVFCLARTLKG